MLVIAQGEELAASRSAVWGTGGWDPPEEREARDWLCLGRLLGWEVELAAPEELAGAASAGLIVWTGTKPDDAAAARLRARLETEAALLVIPEHVEPTRSFAGRRLVADDRVWTCAAAVTASELPLAGGGRAVASLDGRPVAVVRAVGPGAVLTLGFHPSAARDADGAFTALLRELLVAHAPHPMPCRDWQGTLALRMDDPGSCESAYREGWRYPKLGRRELSVIADALRRRGGRMTAAYAPAFADDGDPQRGTLRVGGRLVDRRAGALHRSALVRYEAAGLVWDGVEEHAALEEQRDVLDLALHGHAHLHPDRAAWALAADRYESERWYRDLVAHADGLPDAEHPLVLGLAALEASFGRRPSTLVCPGDAWTTDALTRALALGFELISSYYTALRHGDGWVWSQHVCAPYLDEPDPRWFAAGLPVVGYFHDHEPSVHGVGWLTAQLDAWEAAGATRLIALGDLADALGAPPSRFSSRS